MKGGNGKLPIKVVLCAGQGCTDRESCARYRVRGGEFQWASWDIERRGREGPCPVYIQIRQEKHRK